MTRRSKLRVGDRVRYRGRALSNADEIRVTRIEKTHEPGEAYGEVVKCVLWDSTFVADLDDGHWVYNHQIAPIEVEEAVA